MKPILCVIFFTGFFLSAFGQCDKTATLKCVTGRAVKGDLRQPDMAIEATITIDKEKIVISASFGGQSAIITNTINKVDLCDWKEYLKSGQAILKVLTDKGNGQLENSTIKITGKDGKTTIYFGSDPDEQGGLEFDISEIKIAD